MTENVKRVLIFVAGVGIGVLASWRFFKKKYRCNTFNINNNFINICII